MKPDKAIKQLRQLSEPPEIIFHSDDIKAVQLGIEALERVLLHRTDRRYPFNTPLPSETKE